MYDDYIVLKGRDFVKNINLPNATYILYTGDGESRTNGNVDNNISNEDRNVVIEDAAVINTTIEMNQEVGLDNNNIELDADDDNRLYLTTFGGGVLRLENLNSLYK